MITEHLDNTEWYVDVILPLAIRQSYTYAINAEEAKHIQIGMRVVVPLGRSKLYSAVVIKIHKQKPEFYETKPIEYILDNKPIINAIQIDFWKWIAEYYMCSPGEVYRAALPSGLRLESELKIRLNASFDLDLGHKSSSESRLVDILRNQKDLSISEATKLLNRKNIFPMVKKMQEEGILSVNEEVRHTYKPKEETFVRLASGIRKESDIEAVFDKIGKAQKQEDLFLKFLSLSNPFSENPKQLSRAFLIKEAQSNSSVLKALEKKGILELYQEVVGRLKSRNQTLEPKKELSEAQNTALQNIESEFLK